MVCGISRARRNGLQAVFLVKELPKWSAVERLQRWPPLAKQRAFGGTAKQVIPTRHARIRKGTIEAKRHECVLHHLHQLHELWQGEALVRRLVQCTELWQQLVDHGGGIGRSESGNEAREALGLFEEIHVERRGAWTPLRRCFCEDEIPRWPIRRRRPLQETKGGTRSVLAELTI